MKRLGILLLLVAFVAGQSAWLFVPAVSASLQDVVNAEDDDVPAIESKIPEPTPTETETPLPTATASNTAVPPTFTPTSTSPPAASTSTIGATQTSRYKNLKPGDTVRINVSVLNVRSGGSTTFPIVAQATLGQTFVVLEGPVAANNFNWIRVDMGSTPTPRWMAAQYVDLASSGPSPTPSRTPTATNTPNGLATATNTPPAGPTQTPTYKNLKPGNTIAVTVAVLNVRSGTSTSSPNVAQVLMGQTFQILQGPIRNNGYDWIRIDMGATATERWLAAQFVDLVSSGPTATPTLSPTASNTPTQTSTPNGSETATPTVTQTPAIAADNYVAGNSIVVTAGVNVRSGAGTSFSILKVALPGEQGLVVAGNTAGGSYTWTRVNFGNVTGWVAINFITHASMTTPTPQPGAWLVSLTLDCFSNPERIAIANSAQSSIQIYSIRTHFDAGSDEPWVLNHTLGAGQTRSYLMGPGASGSFALTSSYRLTDSAGTAEGVTVETSLGTLSRSCPAQASGERWVEVNLSQQYMTVWQGNTRITGTYVSTGKPRFDTPTGTYRTWLKYVSQTMSGCILGECYVVPNVPYVHYFTYGGHALHGAYWHNNFGTVRSHGCVNLPVPFSEWLYYWLPMNARVVIHY
ncbi:hypothetical protein BH23CHL5_BH23CHL5_10770 [soil metagenome]